MCYTSMEINEEIIPFTVEIKGEFYYRYESDKYDKDKAKSEIYAVLSEAVEEFENYVGDIEVQEAYYNINI